MPWKETCLECYLDYPLEINIFYVIDNLKDTKTVWYYFS
jgi:hypothetical protein